MTLTKKRDVNGYYAAKGKQGSRIHIVPTSQPDATGFSANEPDLVETAPANFDQDFTLDHSSLRKPLPSAGDLNAPPDPQGSEASGRVRK